MPSPVATWRGPTRAEVRFPGEAPTLVVDYSGITGEWTPVAISIDGQIRDLGDLDLPPCFSMNEETLAALEAIA